MKVKINRYGLIALVLLLAGWSCSKNKAGDGEEDPPPDQITYEYSAEIFPNPERGFIRTMPVKSGGEGLVQNQLNTLRAQNISMVLRLFYFDAFTDKMLDAAMLQFIQDDLDKIRSAGLKAILRFAYTDDMDGADAPLNIVEQHIGQLKPLFEANQDIIAFVQAGFIGAWGEWHSSSNGLATTENQRAVLNKLLDALPADIMVQVRTPGYKQQIFNSTTALTSTEAYSSEPKARVGHHNDCFLSGGNDYGTYNNVALEKQYISAEALYVPAGGETCPPTGGFNPTCVESRNEMKLLKWTYLNLDWYPATIAAWKNSGCFDEFQSNLGYRLALVEGNLPTEINAGGLLKVQLSITNKGYAPLYHKKNAVLVLKNTSTGDYYDKPLSTDLRACKPMATLEIDEQVALAGVPAGSYALYLTITDRSTSLSQRPEYAVRLANKNAWVEEHGGINNLNHTVTIK